MTGHEIILAGVVIGILILSASVHEAAHAWVAYKCGDDTAKRQGRMTLNPLDHIDPFMSILMPAALWIMSSGTFIFGGAKPVPVYPPNLKYMSRDMMYVAIAGPISNILQAILYMFVYKGLYYFTDYPPQSMLMQASIMAVWLNIVLAVFNMIPFPPLDGSRVARHFVPQAGKELIDRLEQFGMLAIIAILYLIPGSMGFVGDVSNWIWDLMFTITGGSWQ